MRTVIFDMDGLMFDTMQVFAKAWDYAGEKLGLGKAGIYLKACELLDTKPEHCIALEDSKNGLLAAHRAGCQPVMVPDLWQPDEEILRIIKGKYANLEAVRCAFENGEL